MADRIYVLRISPGPSYPPTSLEPSPSDHLDPAIHVDVVQSCWGNPLSAPAAKFDRPNVRYHFTYSSKRPSLVRFFWDVGFSVKTGMKIRRSGRPFRVIVAYGPTKTALAGLLLKWLTGARLVVEFPGDPRTAYVADSEHPTRTDRLKQRMARVWTRFLLRWVDRASLLFPDQIDIYPESKTVPQTVIPAVVAVDAVPQGQGDDRYVLLLGFPWHLKGADVLIKAFRRISPEFPSYTLKIVGHCPDRAPYESLRGDCGRIEFFPGVHRPKALELIARCTVLVLPSRTEAMGRVLIEAMAAGKPVIASRVGGIPYHVHDGEWGLLFQSENVEELEACLRRILGDETLRRRLGAAGWKRAHENYGERQYASHLSELIRQTIRESGDRPLQDLSPRDDKSSAK